jgi:ABC-type transport system involved in cytochrome c biogenesis ATPase subunit
VISGEELRCTTLPGVSKEERMEKEKEHLNYLTHQNAYKSSTTMPINLIFKTLMEIRLCRVLPALMLEKV